MLAETSKSHEIIAPLSYHYQVREYIQKHEKKVWDFFSNESNKKKEHEKLKIDLLKNTYRLSTETNPLIFEALNDAKKALNFDYDCIVYQGEGSQELNAGIIFSENEAHIVLHGDINSKLNKDELVALLGHEISHAILWRIENGEFETTSKIITAIANDYSNDESFYETARIFSLCTEIFADHGALKACGKMDIVISMLLKISTGISKVSPSSYLEQAQEILNKDEKGSEGYTHPENYIRALALQWRENIPDEADEKIIDLLQGKIDVERLDIFQQENLFITSYRLLQALLSPKWFQKSAIKQLADDYFKDFKFIDKQTISEEDKLYLSNSNEDTKQYLAYMLFDFCMVDEDLVNVPFAQASQIALDIEIEEEFEAIIIKELKLSKKKFADLKKEWQRDFLKI